jgi:hypothetical protein
MAEHTSTDSVSLEQLHSDWAAQGGRGRSQNTRLRKLSLEQVMEIRNLYASRVSVKEIGKRYRTSISTLYPIVSGRCYKHLPMPKLMDLSLPGEEWRPCFGWEAQYAVSNLGRVRRVTSGKATRAGRLLKPSPIASGGYLAVTLPKPGSCEKIAMRVCVHRLVAEAFLGPRPAGMEINHKHQDRTDNRPENLEYVTREENLRHALRNHRKGVYRGLNGFIPTAVLLERDAVAILNRLRQGDSRCDLAREFGISPVAIDHLQSDKWMPARVYYNPQAIDNSRRSGRRPRR